MQDIENEYEQKIEMGKKIRKLREERGIKSQDLAMQLGIQKPTMSRLESGYGSEELFKNALEWLEKNERLTVPFVEPIRLLFSSSVWASPLVLTYMNEKDRDSNLLKGVHFSTFYKDNYLEPVYFHSFQKTEENPEDITIPLKEYQIYTTREIRELINETNVVVGISYDGLKWNNEGLDNEHGLVRICRIMNTLWGGIQMLVFAPKTNSVDPTTEFRTMLRKIIFAARNNTYKDFKIAREELSGGKQMKFYYYENGMSQFVFEKQFQLLGYDYDLVHLNPRSEFREKLKTAIEREVEIKGNYLIYMGTALDTLRLTYSYENEEPLYNSDCCKCMEFDSFDFVVTYPDVHPITFDLVTTQANAIKLRENQDFLEFLQKLQESISILNNKDYKTSNGSLPLPYRRLAQFFFSDFKEKELIDEIAMDLLKKFDLKCSITPSGIDKHKGKNLDSTFSSFLY